VAPSGGGTLTARGPQWPRAVWRRAQRFAAHIDVQEADHRDRRAHHHAVPIWLRRIVLLEETSLLENLADDAARDVNRAVPDIVGIVRAGRKVDATRIGGVRRHFAEHERAVGRAQRTHAEAIEHVAVRKSPVAPRQEACEVGLEIFGREAVIGKNGTVPDQDSPVPEFWPFALSLGKMRLDFAAASFRERPGKRPHRKIERRDAVNDGRGHALPPPCGEGGTSGA